MKRSFSSLQIVVPEIIKPIYIYIEAENGRPSGYNYARIRHNDVWYRSQNKIPKCINDVAGTDFDCRLIGDRLVLDPKPGCIYKQLVFVVIAPEEDPVKAITGEPHCFLRADIQILGDSMIVDGRKHDIPYGLGDIERSCDYVQIRGHYVTVCSFKKLMPITKLFLSEHQVRNAPDGEFHLVGGVSVQIINDCIYHYYLGKLHRKDKPAVENTNGSELWYTHGVLKKSAQPVTDGVWRPIQLEAGRK